MDTKSNGIDNKTEATTNKSEETTKQLTQKTQEEIYSPPPAGSIAYKLQAKWIRTLLFILSGFLVAYGLTAIMALSCFEYCWDIESAVMGEQRYTDKSADSIENKVFTNEIENLYGSLCVISSQVLRYDNSSFEYLNSVSSELHSTADSAFLDEGSDFKTIALDDNRFEYFIGYSDKCYTNIDGLSAGSGYDEIAAKLKSDDAFYIRLGDKIYTGGSNKQRIGITDYEYDSSFRQAEPKLPLGAAYYDEDYKAHIYNYYNYSSYTTVFENEDMFMEEISEADDDESAHIPYYKGGVRYKYNEKLDELIAEKTLTKLDDSGIKVAIGVKPYSDKTAAVISKDDQISVSKGLVISLLPVGAVLFVITIMLMVRCGYSRDTGLFEASKWFDKRFSAELFVLSAMAAMAAEISLHDSLSGDIKIAFDRKNLVFFGSFALGTFLLWIIGFGSVLVILRKLKTRNFFRTSLIVKLLMFITKGINTACEKGGQRLMLSPYNKLTLSRKILIRNAIFGVMTAILIITSAVICTSGGWSADDTILASIYVTVYAVYFIWFFLSTLDHFHNAEILCEKLDTVSRGEKFEGEKVSKDSPFFEYFKSLDTLDERIKVQTQEMVKSERTKVELVTNVSHDLKTPLTSIISYTYLLSKEDMSDEAKDYVKILQQKSEKLKSIVNDVFTLAKAASGAEIKNERLDLTMLVNQTAASNQDIIDRSGVTVKVTTPEMPVHIMGDGDKLSRVFQNLLDNALKYSLKGTRVFIEMTMTDDKAQVAFKNTSAEEMSFTAEEITERFTRGDKSRTDGGSGLGLSIAKTFTEASGGKFHIELDGDMFKAITEFDLLYHY